MHSMSDTNMDSRESQHRNIKVLPTDGMKLTNSASEQNVFFTYVCLVDDIHPSQALYTECEQIDKQAKLLEHPTNDENDIEELPIQVERTKALHELVGTIKHGSQIKKTNHESNSTSTHAATTSGEDSEFDKTCDNYISCDNLNILKLTKMKWLSEEQEDSLDSSSPSFTSSTSSCSRISECAIDKTDSYGDKYLSTIIRLDKEHNMFGLSNIAIVGSRPSKQKRNGKDEDRPVFHQTAIVQICCEKRCCNNMSRTDLPASLKCGGRRSCFDTRINCADCARSSLCAYAGGALNPPCPSPCWPCPPPGPCCGTPAPGGCKVDYCSYYGLKIKVNRKSKYIPTPPEITPRAPCVLCKPVAARRCTHTPQCQPPSSFFPYLMPCYWPARASAPCTHPDQCFHNPPCMAPRDTRKVPCQSKCAEASDPKCKNETCPMNVPKMKAAIEKRAEMEKEAAMEKKAEMEKKAAMEKKAEMENKAAKKKKAKK